jgi:competence protein ComGC
MKVKYTNKDYVIIICFAAIFISILIPNYLRGKQQGSITPTCRHNLKNIGSALELYTIDHEGNYPEKLSDLTPDYVAMIWKCDRAGTDTYSKSYQVFNDPRQKIHAYTFYCQGEHHCPELEANFPQYTSKNGLTMNQTEFWKN